MHIRSRAFAAALSLAGFVPAQVAPGGTESLTATPLRERAAREGKRFQRLDPATTGLQFQNELRRENIIPYVYAGAGVAVGDYDADGLPDVFLVSQDGQNKLFRQTAPMRFDDVTERAGKLGGGDAWGTAASFVDVDQDGDLDLYVANLEAPNQLWRNRGDGTFAECAAELGLDVVAATMGVAFADYDQDGDLDLYVLTNRVFGPRLPAEIVAEATLPTSIKKTRAELFPPQPEFPRRDGRATIPAGYEDFYFAIDDQVFSAGQPDRLLRNDGARFTDVTKAAGIHDHGQGLSVLWWDFDGDGRLDLYVANDLQSPDALYRNRGDGTFEDIVGKALPYTTFFSMGSDFGDVDGDGRFDLCVADMSATTHYMGKMLMGSMSAQRWFLMNARPLQAMRNTLFLNSGTGRCLEAAYLAGVASTDWTWTIRLCDLDDDGWLDLFATNGIPSFEDNPDLGRQIQRLWRAGRHDAALDVARNLPRVDERNVARRNTGDLRFVDCGAEWGLDELSVGNGAVVTDLDRDGDLDIVVNNLNAEASVFENRGATGHRALVSLVGTASNRQGIGARITVQAGGRSQVRLVSPTRGYMSAGETVEHFGLGEAERIERLHVRWPSGREQVFADLAADRYFVIREAGDGGVPEVEAAAPLLRSVDVIAARHVERPFDDYAVQPLLPHRLSQMGPGIAGGDVDGDGVDEVFVGGAAGQAGSLWTRKNGAFVPIDGPWAADAECEDMGALFVDRDRDGDMDLLVASGSIETGPELRRLRVYDNDGRGGFVVAPTGVVPELSVAASSLGAADVDRDGDLEVFVGGYTVPGRYPEAPSSVLLRNDDGRFVDATATLAPQLQQAGMVTGATFADVDGDGWQDLVVAAQWQPLVVHRNEQGRLVAMANSGLADRHGQWNSVSAADLDGDGDLDLVAGNLGLNTKYKATAESPLRLFARDFDDNGQFDVVEAKQQGGVELPVRGLSCSSEAMPMLADRFPTYHAFAKATLAEIYGQGPLAGAMCLEVHDLQTRVFENQGGKFVARELPRLLQGSCVSGVGIADFDGDGVLDLLAAQNSFAPEPETGRNAGGLGLLLRGGKDLRFEPVPADRSGIVMPEDAKAVAIVDFDGDARPDVLVTTNDGPVRGFGHGGSAAGLAVTLRGEPGNPTAIGARIELVPPTGPVQVRVLTAGSGYLSQSAAVAFFANVPAGSKLQVQWPDGGRSEHAPEARTGIVRLQR
ncbi:MAG: VCBS repeat-containing protein [Planctomycetes bacterium]|nr:VCBS repeat-containing protein [Planctomycetota bacterium]